MTVVGLLAEYNPFHLGHQYQLETIKEHYPYSPLIVLMSGNVVQRGEFAILSKWQRAELALCYGADLVIELPIFASLQAADFFARIGVDMLGRLGVNVLAFGSEGAQTQDLKEYYEQLLLIEDKVDQKVPAYIAEGLSYAAAYQQSVQKYMPEPFDFDPSSSNHLLGLQYIRSIDKLNLKMQPWVLTRTHHYQNKEIHSGSQIRADLIKGGMNNKLALPPLTLDMLEQSYLVEMEAYYPFIQYRLCSMEASDLQTIFGVREGLENLLLKIQHNNYEQLVSALISKRWTRSAIQRILLAILLNISEENFKEAQKAFLQDPYLRILGYNDVGQSYLRHMKNKENVTLFSNLRQEIAPRYDLTLRADRVYQLASPTQIKEQNRATYPIYIKK